MLSRKLVFQVSQGLIEIINCCDDQPVLVNSVIVHGNVYYLPAVNSSPVFLPYSSWSYGSSLTDLITLQLWQKF